jgi:hypothetical protein
MMFITLNNKELTKSRENSGGQVFALCFAFESQVVACAFDDQQLGFRRNQFACCLNLLDRAKWIARAVHKKRRYMKLGQMLRPGLFRPAWRVQRIGQQKQPVGEFSVGDLSSARSMLAWRPP